MQVPILLAPTVCGISKILPARTASGTDVDTTADSGTDVDATADSGTDVDTTADSGVDTDADSGTDVDSDVDSGMDTTADGGTDGGTNVDSDAYNGVDTAAYRGTATDAEDDIIRLHRCRPQSRLCLGHHPLGSENAGQLPFTFEYKYVDECLSYSAENDRPRAFRSRP